MTASQPDNPSASEGHGYISLKERYWQEMTALNGKLPTGATRPVAPARQALPGLKPAQPAPEAGGSPQQPAASVGLLPPAVTKKPAPAATPNGQAPHWLLDTELLSRATISAPNWVVRCPRGDGLLPAGLSVLVGDPGSGKSTLIRALIASLTTGEGYFGVKEPSEALFLAWEDDQGSGILPHLLACGGDPGRVHMLRGMKTEDGRQTAWTPTEANMEVLRAFLDCRPGVRLVVVDVLSSLLSMGGVDSSGSEEVRRVLDPLHKLGQELGVAVLLLHHQNKRMGEKALVRVAGSVQVTGTARMVWLLAVDPEDAALRRLAPVKCNLAGNSSGFAFREKLADRQAVCTRTRLLGIQIPDSLPDYLFRNLEVLDTQPVSAEDLLQRVGAVKEESQEDCSEWLLAALAANGGAIASAQLQASAREQGIGERQLERTKCKLRDEGQVGYKKRAGSWWVVGKNHNHAETARTVFDN